MENNINVPSRLYRPCPFCGSKLIDYVKQKTKLGYLFYVECLCCEARTKAIGLTNEQIMDAKIYAFSDPNDPGSIEQHLDRLHDIEMDRIATAINLWNRRHKEEEHAGIPATIPGNDTDH